jgi:hypothetical protein
MKKLVPLKMGFFKFSTTNPKKGKIAQYKRKWHLQNADISFAHPKIHEAEYLLNIS